MRKLRRNVCAVVIVAALSAITIPAVAGYAGIEGGPTPAAAQTGGIVGGVVAHLKHEDDEVEVQQLAEEAPSLTEREAARERREDDEGQEAVSQEPSSPEAEG
ncbi:MAG TPA: hypothetical protein VII01_07395 [Solirubrobacteraceae bacterium]